MRTLALVLLAGSLLSGPSAAQEDAALDRDGPIALWLADQDAAALPRMAALAAAGDDGARVLISLIDRMPETHAPWLLALPRAERVALMRAPDGRSWLDGAGGELAAAWRALWSADTPPETAFLFADLGEPRAARLVLLAHAARQRSGFAELAGDPRYPPELRFLAWAEAPRAPETALEIAALPSGDPQPGRIDAEREPLQQDLAGWLLAAEIAAPVARFCTEACANTAGACALSIYDALGGYRGLLGLGPPSESLIDGSDWAESTKGRRAIPRKLMNLQATGPFDQCVADAVEAASR
jgi:hypothetical protein